MSQPFKAGAVLYAKHVTAVQTFYQQVTGLEVQDSGAGHVVLESSTFQLVILEIPDAIASSIEISSPPERRTQTPVKLVFQIADLRAAREAASRCGGELNSPGHEWNFQGWRVCDGHDPEGNVVQFRQTASA